MNSSSIAQDRIQKCRAALREHGGTCSATWPTTPSIIPGGTGGYIEQWQVRGVTCLLQVEADHHGYELHVPITNTNSQRDTLNAIKQIGIVIDETTAGAMGIIFTRCARVYISNRPLYYALQKELNRLLRARFEGPEITILIDDLRRYLTATETEESILEYVQKLINHINECDPKSREINFFTSDSPLFTTL